MRVRTFGVLLAVVEAAKTHVHCEKGISHVTFEPLDFGGHTVSSEPAEANCRNRCHTIPGCK